jgi:hypothetical protein
MTSPSPDPTLTLERLGGGPRVGLAQETEVLRLALTSGLITPAEVAAWAEAVIQILRAEDPVLRALASAGGSTVDVVAGLLSRVTGPRSSDRALSEVFLTLYTALSRQPRKAGRVAQALDRLVAAGVAPELEAPLRMWAFSRRLEAGRGGPHDAVQEATMELREFLASHISVRNPGLLRDGRLGIGGPMPDSDTGWPRGTGLR